LEALEASKQLAYEATEQPAAEVVDDDQIYEGDELFSESIVSATTDLITAISDQNAARTRGDVDGPLSRPVSRLAEARDQLVEAEAAASRERAEEIELRWQNKRNWCAIRVQSIFRGFRARWMFIILKAQRAEELIAERKRRYHETRIQRGHRYVGEPRGAAMSPWPTSRPSSPVGFATRRFRTRIGAGDDAMENSLPTPWGYVSRVSGALTGLTAVLKENEDRQREEESDEEEVDTVSLAFDTTKLLAELKEQKDEEVSPMMSPAKSQGEPVPTLEEEDDLDLLVMATNQPAKAKKKQRQAQPRPPAEKGPSKYKALAKASATQAAGIASRSPGKPSPQPAEPEIEPPALSSTPTPGPRSADETLPEEVNYALPDVEVTSETSSHGPLWCKHEGQPTSPTCFNEFRRAIESLRNAVQETFADTGPAPPQKGQEVKDLVQKEYLEACSVWHVKPNSKVLATIAHAKVLFTDCDVLKPFTTAYDFSGAHLGDRGAICVLLAMARDVSCSNLSLHKCALHNASAPLIAEFLKLHPSLVQIDLSSNAFSFHAGQLFLQALGKRERPRGSLHDLAAATVCVNLGDTALSTKVQHTSTAPCGILWGKHGRLAPSEYGKLIDELKDTRRVRYDHIDHFDEVSTTAMTLSQNRAFGPKLSEQVRNARGYQSSPKAKGTMVRQTCA